MQTLFTFAVGGTPKRSDRVGGGVYDKLPICNLSKMKVKQSLRVLLRKTHLPLHRGDLDLNRGSFQEREALESGYDAHTPLYKGGISLAGVWCHLP